jgi:hypothetical protein
MVRHRLSHTQREAIVIQELQTSFPGFADVSSWSPVADDPPDVIGSSPTGIVGLELVEWLDGIQMGAAQGRKSYREKLWKLLGAGWATEYQPKNLSSAVVCPFWDRKPTQTEQASLKSEFWRCVEDVDLNWADNPNRQGSNLLVRDMSWPVLSKFIQAIRLRSGEQSWKTYGFSWIDIEEDGGSYDPNEVIRTLELSIRKKVDLYNDPQRIANLQSKKLDRLELLVHGGFNLFFYNTPMGSLSVSDIASAGAAYYARLPLERRVFDRIWLFNSLNPASDLNELVGFDRNKGQLRWLVELWPNFSVDSRSFG